MERHVGNYELGPLLARGGSSEVYAGRHRFLGDAVAIKLLRLPPGDTEVAAALVAEATRTRAIEHPNVVRVLDVGVDEPSHCWYLVMERVDGEDLAARLARTGAVDEAEARRLGAAIADGLAAAHARGIVHRDVKPANVMLGGETPKLVDFGIAKALGDRSAATTERRIGTPQYMAPEQLVGGRIAPAVDIWALGVILFELVTGRLPFTGYDGGRCPQLFEVAPRVATIAPVSAAYDALVARCLDPDPGLRPPTVGEIAAALRAPGDGGERHTVDLAAAPVAAAAAPVTSRARPRWALRAAVITGVAAIAIVAVAALRAPAARVAPDAAVDAAAAGARAIDAAPAALTPERPDAGRPDPADHHHHADDRDDHGGSGRHPGPPDARPADAREGLD